MSRLRLSLILLICLALAFAGLPAHACAVSATGEMDNAVETSAEQAAAPCPHHAPPASETVADDSIDSNNGDESGCCGVDCGCRCGATAPALIFLSSPGAETMRAAELSFAAALAPSLTPDRLLRPPIPSA